MSEGHEENGMEEDPSAVDGSKETKEDSPGLNMLLKGKSHFYYNINHALRIVLVNPLSQDGLAHPEFQKACQSAYRYKIFKHKTKKGRMEAALYYKTVDAGDTAFMALRRSIQCEVEDEEQKTEADKKAAEVEDKDINDIVNKIIEDDDEKPNEEETPATEAVEVERKPSKLCKVLHPNFTVTLSAAIYWANLPKICTIAESPLIAYECKKQALTNTQLFECQVLLENVPEDVTDAQLYERFPEVHSVLLYPYALNSTGFAMLEFLDPESAKNFVKDCGDKVDFNGVELKATVYLVKLAEWRDNKPVPKPGEPKKIPVSWIMDTDEVIEDDKRLEICEQVKELEDDFLEAINSLEFFSTQKIREYQRLHQVIIPLRDSLKTDTNRRRLEKIPFPESEDLMTAYTKFAQTKWWQEKFEKSKAHAAGKSAEEIRLIKQKYKSEYKKPKKIRGAVRGDPKKIKAERQQAQQRAQGYDFSRAGNYSGGGFQGPQGQSQLTKAVEGLTVALANSGMQGAGDFGGFGGRGGGRRGGGGGGYGGQSGYGGGQGGGYYSNNYGGGGDGGYNAFNYGNNYGGGASSYNYGGGDYYGVGNNGYAGGNSNYGGGNTNYGAGNNSYGGGINTYGGGNGNYVGGNSNYAGGNNRSRRGGRWN